ncbi:FGGY-family carbohydrate kinase [Komagataeibacter rhaeticus]|nr:FGGY-family carbohydrate kinase [Komagataeibacter rhaeticus]
MRGVFAGLSQGTTRAQMTQAVLEGVAFSFRDVVDVLAAAGSVVREADVIGVVRTAVSGCPSWPT